MRKTTGLIVVALALLAGAASGRDHRQGSLSVANRDGVPYVVEIDERSHTIRILPPGSRGSFEVPPGGDVASRVQHGDWTVVGDGSRTLAFYIHTDHNYQLVLQPFSRGGYTGLLGQVDDGYHSYSEALYPLAERRGYPVPVIPDQPPYEVIDPRHSPEHNLGEALGEAAGEAIVDVIGNLLDKDHDRPPHHRPPPPPPPHRGGHDRPPEHDRPGHDRPPEHDKPGHDRPPEHGRPPRHGRR